MRLIDADVFKKYIRDACNEMSHMYKDGGKWAKQITEDFCMDIDEQPTIEPQRWIPCSERLPEESDGTILVCFPDEFPYNNKEPYVNAKHNQRVKTAFYSQFSKTWYIGDLGAIGEVRPIAWMPLPEPWKENKDEG